MLSQAAAIRRRTLQQNAVNTGNTERGAQHMDDWDSRQEVRR